MLGRLIYVALIAAVILAGGFAFDFLSKEEGRAVLEFGGQRYEFTLFQAALFAVAGIAAIVIGIWAIKLIIATIRLLMGNPRGFDWFFGRMRQRNGLKALSKAMVALEAGDAKTARKKAEIAERKLNDPDLTRLVNAKAAELAGDKARAETYYKAMLEDPKTAFVGANGLLQRAMVEGNTERALKLARHAQVLNPKDQSTLDTLYTLQSQKFDWAGARKTLEVQKRAGYVPKLEAVRREAALTLAQAGDLEEQGDAEQARRLAVEAAKKDPGNIGAVTTAVRLLIEGDSKRAASKLVQSAWRAGPDLRLAKAYAEIEPDESPAQRRRRFQALFDLQPNHRETQFLKAELALVAEDWSGARAALSDLRETQPSVRSCAIMAAIARGEDEPDHVVRGWLAKALDAPRTDQTDSEITNVAMLPLLEPSNPDVTGSTPDQPDADAMAPAEGSGPDVDNMSEDHADPKPAPDILVKDTDGSVDSDQTRRAETVT